MTSALLLEMAARLRKARESYDVAVAEAHEAAKQGERTLLAYGSAITGVVDGTSTEAAANARATLHQGALAICLSKERELASCTKVLRDAAYTVAQCLESDPEIAAASPAATGDVAERIPKQRPSGEAEERARESAHDPCEGMGGGSAGGRIGLPGAASAETEGWRDLALRAERLLDAEQAAHAETRRLVETERARIGEWIRAHRLAREQAEDARAVALRGEARIAELEAVLRRIAVETHWTFAQNLAKNALERWQR